MALTREEIEQLAQLSRLAIDDAMVTQLQQDLAKMMTQVAAVQEVDTANVDMNQNVSGAETQLRDDEATLPTTNLTAGAAQHQDGFVVVPKVIG